MKNHIPRDSADSLPPSGRGGLGGGVSPRAGAGQSPLQVQEYNDYLNGSFTAPEFSDDDIEYVGYTDEAQNGSTEYYFAIKFTLRENAGWMFSYGNLSDVYADIPVQTYRSSQMERYISEVELKEVEFRGDYITYQTALLCVIDTMDEAHELVEAQFGNAYIAGLNGHVCGKDIRVISLWNIMVPNKSKKNVMAKFISGTEGDVFEEMTDPIISFVEKIDLLVLYDCIVTSDYKLLQNSFGFHDYIRLRADKTICAVEDKGIVDNVDKLRDYVKRGNGKPRYAKKMMRITDSKVLKMEPDKLWENIHKSTRWNGKIKENNGKFVINSYSDVENLIDLLDERYTRSDITDVEYDTDVKQEADPVTESKQ